MVDHFAVARAQLHERLVNRHETVPGVDVRCVDNAVLATVKVGAVEALVADALDELYMEPMVSPPIQSCFTRTARTTNQVADITDSSVHNVAAGRHLHNNLAAKICPIYGSSKCMARVVAVGVAQEAILAEIVVIAIDAVDKEVFGQFCIAHVSHQLAGLTPLVDRRYTRGDTTGVG
jgi:hypothetical protein